MRDGEARLRHQHDDERLNLPGLTPAEKEARLRRSQTRCDAFAAGLDRAADNGVEVLVYNCAMDLGSISISGRMDWRR